MVVMKNRKKLVYKYVVVIFIILVIAAVHLFRVGSYLDGVYYQYYYGYFSDIVVPFGMYFLLCMNDLRFVFLRKWTVKCLLVFGFASITEIMQAFGVPILGRTFDPLDFVMFGIGVITAALIEKQLFERIFPFWSPENA